MKRIYVICEGFTELDFVRELLAPDFYEQMIFLIPRLLGDVGHQGGRVTDIRILKDVHRLLVDKTAYCTTFFFFYGLHDDFVGMTNAKKLHSPEEKSKTICSALKNAVTGDDVNRFIPYVQMYEFEGLLFSHPEKFAKGIWQPKIADKLQAIRDDKRFQTPEYINDNYLTAPSKRIMSIFAGYEKRTHGIIASLEIGLPTMRRECPIFNQWLTDLEALPLLA